VRVEWAALGAWSFFGLFASALDGACYVSKRQSTLCLQAIGVHYVATIVCAAILNSFGDRCLTCRVHGFLGLFLGMAARAFGSTETQALRQSTL